jgi:ornithine carbamoyltransferase
MRRKARASARRKVQGVSPSSSTAVPQRIVWSRDAFSASHRARLIGSAERIRKLAGEGCLGAPLAGRNLALVGGAIETEHSAAMRAATLGLGARVARLRREDAQTHDIAGTARILGRLYDAIHCEGLAAATVECIEQHAGVPIFDETGDAQRMLTQVAQQLDASRRGHSQGLVLALQALLLEVLA